MLKQLPFEALQPLTQLLTEMERAGRSPGQWRVVKFAMLAKKADIERPIWPLRCRVQGVASGEILPGHSLDEAVRGDGTVGCREAREHLSFRIHPPSVPS